MSPDDPAGTGRPLSPREQREFEALACRLDHDTGGPAVRRRARFGIAASAICVGVAVLALLVGAVLAAGVGVAALGLLLGVALVTGR